MNAHKDPFKATYTFTTKLENGRFAHTYTEARTDDKPKSRGFTLDFSKIAAAQAHANKIRQELQS